MMNAKNIIKNMITCIILTRIMCYNPFVMMKMKASMTRYHIFLFSPLFIKIFMFSNPKITFHHQSRVLNLQRSLEAFDRSISFLVHIFFLLSIIFAFFLLIF